jgi:ABC-type siderophore export system fused ATPase/permease subunit
LESRNIEFADFATVIISIFALLPFASLDYVASGSLLVPIITIVVVVITVFLVFRNFRRLEAEYLSARDEYMELRKKQAGG